MTLTGSSNIITAEGFETVYEECGVKVILKRNIKYTYI